MVPEKPWRGDRLSGRGCAVDIPQWMWGMLLMWVSITIGTGIRLYRTRRSWMRKYREDQPQR